MTVDQFGTLSYIQGFNAHAFLVKCRFTFKDMGMLIKEEWRSKKSIEINGLSYDDFNERRLKDCYDGDIIEYITTLLNIDSSDIEIYANDIIINHFDKYEDDLSDYKIELIDFSDNTFNLTI